MRIFFVIVLAIFCLYSAKCSVCNSKFSVDWGFKPVIKSHERGSTHSKVLLESFEKSLAPLFFRRTPTYFHTKIYSTSTTRGEFSSLVVVQSIYRYRLTCCSTSVCHSDRHTLSFESGKKSLVFLSVCNWVMIGRIYFHGTTLFLSLNFHNPGMPTLLLMVLHLANRSI